MFIPQINFVVDCEMVNIGQVSASVSVINKNMPIKLVAFDLLYIGDKSIINQPITYRRQELLKLYEKLEQPYLFDIVSYIDISNGRSNCDLFKEIDC